MNEKFAEIYNKINSEMLNAVSDYRDPFHLFSIASISEERPTLRTVVLRSYSVDNKFFEFHSDIRSPKVEQIKENPNFSALFYNPKEKIQLRFSGEIKILHNNATTKERWKGISNSSRRCYLGQYAPSSVIDNDHPNIPEEFRFGDPSSEQTSQGYGNFIIMQCQFKSIDYLSLKYSGHSRCRFDLAGKNVSVCWLAP